MALSLNKQMRFLQKRRESPVLYTSSLFFSTMYYNRENMENWKKIAFLKDMRRYDREIYTCQRARCEDEKEKDAVLSSDKRNGDLP